MHLNEIWQPVYSSRLCTDVPLSQGQIWLIFSHFSYRRSLTVFRQNIASGLIIGLDLRLIDRIGIGGPKMLIGTSLILCRCCQILKVQMWMTFSVAEKPLGPRGVWAFSHPRQQERHQGKKFCSHQIIKGKLD